MNTSIGSFQHQYLTSLLSCSTLTIKEAQYRLSVFNTYVATYRLQLKDQHD